MDEIFWFAFMSVLVFGMNIWGKGGTIALGVYYLLYILTFKMKDSVQSTSFVVRTPLVIGCVNIIGVSIGIYIMFDSFFILSNPLFICSYIYYLFLAIPLSIGSIAISFIAHTNNLISIKKLKFIVLMNIIGIILVFWYILFMLSRM